MPLCRPDLCSCRDSLTCTGTYRHVGIVLLPTSSSSDLWLNMVGMQSCLITAAVMFFAEWPQSKLIHRLDQLLNLCTDLRQYDRDRFEADTWHKCCLRISCCQNATVNNCKTVLSLMTTPLTACTPSTPCRHSVQMADSYTLLVLTC